LSFEDEEGVSAPRELLMFPDEEGGSIVKSGFMVIDRPKDLSLIALPFPLFLLIAALLKYALKERVGKSRRERAFCFC
jgi:hypothetical protein